MIYMYHCMYESRPEINEKSGEEEEANLTNEFESLEPSLRVFTVSVAGIVGHNCLHADRPPD